MADMAPATKKTAVKHALVPGTTYYLGLNSTTPGTTGAHEITTYSGNRKAIKFGTPDTTGKQVSVTTAQTFVISANIQAKYISIWSAATGGSYLWGGASGLSGTATVPNGATLKFAAGAVSAQVS